MFFPVLSCLFLSRGKCSLQMTAKPGVPFLGEQRNEISVEPLSWSACRLLCSSEEVLSSLLLFSTGYSGASVK